MKKYWIIFIFMFLGCKHPYEPFIESKEYTEINHNILHVPSIIEFFSFLCPYCYDLETKYNINFYIKKKIPQTLKIFKYHVNLSKGEFEQLLTKIWAVSVITGLEKNILIPIYEGIQKKHTITNIINLTNTFLKLTKMSKKDFNFITNSFVIKSFLYKQEQIQKSIKLNHVPTFLINERYVVNNKIMQNESIKNFTIKFIKIIQFLLKKNI